MSPGCQPGNGGGELGPCGSGEEGTVSSPGPWTVSARFAGNLAPSVAELHPWARCSLWPPRPPPGSMQQGRG